MIQLTIFRDRKVEKDLDDQQTDEEKKFKYVLCIRPRQSTINVLFFSHTVSKDVSNNMCVLPMCTWRQKKRKKINVCKKKNDFKIRTFRRSAHKLVNRYEGCRH